jgi:hypothetical protein
VEGRIPSSGNPPWAAFGVVGTPLRKEIRRALALLDSRPACKEGSRMDVARLR